MNRRVLKIILFFFSLFIFAPLFADINVVNPAKGVWANKQMLVIDTSDGGDFYYSVDGSDPENFGFIYEKPVLLDVEGEINLKIVRIQNGKEEHCQINYAVSPDPAFSKTYAQFISLFYDSGELNYSSGSSLMIPEDLNFTLNQSGQYSKGGELSLASSSVLRRYVPCIIKADGSEKKWRFVIRTLPHVSGLNSIREVPFEIRNWETIVFNSKSYLYKIDDEFWGLPEENRFIDRSVEHKISWQKIDFKTENSIETCILPPKPKFNSFTEENGSISFNLEGENGYQMSVLTEQNKYSEIYSEIGADVFYGDKSEGSLNIGLFYDSVYQGTLYPKYSIDKSLPETPVIKSSFDGFYSRKNVDLNIDTKKNTSLYVAVSRPLLIRDVTIINDTLIEDLKNVSNGIFKKYDNSHFYQNLTQNPGGAVFYKIQAYAENKIAKSPVVEYFVIIDSYNYFFAQNANPENADGSAAHPYNSIKKCLLEINKCKSGRLYVNGNAIFPENEIIELVADCEVKSNEASCFTFGAGSSLEIKNSILQLSDLKIQKQSGNLEQNFIPNFNLHNSTLEIKNCVIASDYEKNGNVINAENSVVKINDSIISVSAVTYCSFISSVNSDLTIRKSTVTTSAERSVILSATSGTLYAFENQFKVSGRSGRIAELFDLSGNFTNNIIKFDLTKSSNFDDMLYLNDKCSINMENNANYGF